MQMISSGVKQNAFAVLFIFCIGLVDRIGLSEASRIHKLISAQNASANLLLYDERFCPVSITNQICFILCMTELRNHFFP